MQPLTLSLYEIEQKFTIESLKEYFNKCKQINITFTIGSYNSHLDIAQDYLNALFFSESIQPFCQSIDYRESQGNICFHLNVEDKIDELAFNIIRFSHEWDIEFEDSFFEFQSDLNKKKVIFPKIADSYMANIIAGKYDWGFDQDQEDEHYNLYPEEEFDFWYSFISPHIGYDVYSSSFAWIIPHCLDNEGEPYDLKQLLLSYGGLDSDLPIMKEAYNFSLGNLPPIVLNDSIIMHFPQKGICLAQQCLFAILKKKKRLLPPPHPNYFYSILLSEDGSLMIVKDSLAQYVFFINYYYAHQSQLVLKPIIKTSEQDLEQDYQNLFDQLVDKFSSLAGHNIDISLPWEQLDDEQFELLCYDLIPYFPVFDPDTRQKMGKSRSRDGGRDIVLYTRSRLNSPATKWIIQCKLLSRGATLSGRKVEVSDVIDQFGAKGFWVMTNGVIDATLTDKLEGISRNRNIEFKVTDYLQIERILAKPQYKNIRKRYFGK